VQTATLGEAGPRLAAELAARHPALIVRDERGGYQLHDEFRDHVQRRLRDETGANGDELHATLATAHATRTPGRRAPDTWD
jgi:hypothetical protein